jgi:hypothetical protein
VALSWTPPDLTDAQDTADGKLLGSTTSQAQPQLLFAQSHTHRHSRRH